MSVYDAFDNDTTFSSAQNTIGEVNQIDFLLEYVAEIILDHKNAFPENGMHNHRSFSHQMKHITIKLIDGGLHDEQPILCASADLPEILQVDYKQMILKEINPPPPKA